MNNRIRAALLAAITLVALAGCNTMSGAGKDIERGGEKSRRRRSSSTSAGARCRPANPHDRRANARSTHRVIQTLSGIAPGAGDFSNAMYY